MSEKELVHCGFVTDLKVGMAQGNSGAGLVMEFNPELSLPTIAVILAPHLVAQLRKTLHNMEIQHGWTETSFPPNKV